MFAYSVRGCMSSTGLCTSSQRSAHQAPARAADAAQFSRTPAIDAKVARAFPVGHPARLPQRLLQITQHVCSFKKLTIRNYHFATLALTRRDSATRRSPARRIDRSDRSQQGDWLNYSLEVIWIREIAATTLRPLSVLKSAIASAALPFLALRSIIGAVLDGCQSITFYVKSPFGRNRTAPAVQCRIAPKCLIAASTRLWTGLPH